MRDIHYLSRAKHRNVEEQHRQCQESRDDLLHVLLRTNRRCYWRRIRVSRGLLENPLRVVIDRRAGLETRPRLSDEDPRLVEAAGFEEGDRRIEHVRLLSRSKGAEVRDLRRAELPVLCEVGGYQERLPRLAVLGVFLDNRDQDRLCRRPFSVAQKDQGCRERIRLGRRSGRGGRSLGPLANRRGLLMLWIDREHLLRPSRGRLAVSGFLGIPGEKEGPPYVVRLGLRLAFKGLSLGRRGQFQDPLLLGLDEARK